MAKYNFGIATEAIITVVREKEEAGHSITKEALVRKVHEETGFNEPRLRGAVEYLYYGNVLQGRKFSRNKLTITGLTPKLTQEQFDKQAEDHKVELGSLETELEATRVDLKAAKEKKDIVEIVVKKNGKKKSFKDSFHSTVPKITELVNARKNILMYGPTGSGKTYIHHQVAELTSLEPYFLSCTTGMSESRLDGVSLPMGAKGSFKYITPDFVKAYEEGGLFMLDEIDAADPNALLVINTALANNRMSLPRRFDKPYADKHPDFVCMASANTLGTGASRQYSGRNQLDASTIDRFLIGKVFVDYDRALEEKLCPNEELRTMLWAIRDGINEHMLERAVSTRFLKESYDMVELGWSIPDVLNSLFLGWREDEFNKVKTYAAQNK